MGGSGELVAFDCTSLADLSAATHEPVWRFDLSTGVILTHVCTLPSQSFACSGQDGQLHVLAPRDDGSLEQCSWSGHQAEAWFVEAVPDAPSLLLSGADDCVL